MRKFLWLVIFISSSALAQKMNIQGQVADSLGSPLPGATVILLKPSDSTLVNFGITNAKGAFILNGLSRSRYLLKITFVGQRTYSATVDPPIEGGDVQLGIIRMREAKTQLDEVVVQDVVPVVVKKDTIEYNATAFKTNPNAVVEDLLKKLPGVEVDNDGNITAQGEQVRRVTVDGKDFFGGSDPKMATRNLPADAIKKVQVHDRKSDQAQFTGIDDGQREKTINLELKPEKRQGAFGNAQAGYGTDDRYQAKAGLNKFSQAQQLSFLGMANNINEQGFGMDDYMNFTGGSQQMASGGGMRIQVNAGDQGSAPLNMGNRANGIMNTYATGLNFSKTFSKKTELTTSYFFNHLDHDKKQSTYRQNFLEDGEYVYQDLSEQNNTNNNHRLNVMLDHKIDSMNSIRFTAAATYSRTDMNVRTASENVDPEGAMLNSNVSTSDTQGETFSMNSNLLFRHKFAKTGRTFSTNLLLNVSNDDRDGTLEADYRNRDAVSQFIRQRNEQLTSGLSMGATASYTEPLGDRKYLEASYSLRQNRNDVNRPVYDVDEAGEIFNDSLSNQYSSGYTYQRGSLNFRMNRRKYSLTISAAAQTTQLVGNLSRLDTQISRSFLNAVPAVRFNYDFSGTRHLRFDYETTVQEPTIQQLQPVVDNRDQLNPYLGNPALKPAYQQSWRLNFNAFDPGTMITFFTFVDIDYTRNAITNAVFNDDFIRTTMPVNVASNTSVNTHATVGFPINPIKSRVSITGTWRQTHGQNVIDAASYDITQSRTGGNVRYDFQYRELLMINLGARLNYQTTSYEFDQPDQRYFNTTYNAEATLSFLRNYQLVSSCEYLIYENQSTGYHQAIPLFNVSVSRFLLKNKTGELRLSASNLLDKVLGVSQTSSVNYVERVTSNSLGRYFMVSFIYALNKQLNPMSGRRGGPGMRIIRD
ncbi:MAG TPA: outer membrane beta-barrel protein [Chryseolinea sp.]|nr:outer membrane beta-barrel protein [Chryseolinea sp.]